MLCMYRLEVHCAAGCMTGRMCISRRRAAACTYVCVVLQVVGCVQLWMCFVWVSMGHLARVGFLAGAGAGTAV